MQKISLIIVSLLLLFITTPHLSANHYVENTSLGRIQVASINLNKFLADDFVYQQKSQWCWAACISMLFDYYDHPLDQRKIVASIYGIDPASRLPNLPKNGIDIARQLNRNWIDDNGFPFQVRLTAAYDAALGINQMNNQWIIQSLITDNPIIIGTRGHAMIVARIKYIDTFYGPNIQSVEVFDPWPGTPFFHPLSLSEMVDVGRGGTVTFLATCQVSSKS